MSLKQICFVSVFFSDDKDEPADPNIMAGGEILIHATKPQNQIRMSSTINEISLRTATIF